MTWINTINYRLYKHLTSPCTHFIGLKPEKLLQKSELKIRAKPKIFPSVIGPIVDRFIVMNITISKSLLNVIGPIYCSE